MTPQPVAAVILLFPCSENIYKQRAKEDRALRETRPSEAAASAYHLEQVASFGNACGTIAAVHALANANIGVAGPMRAFREETIAQTPTERGRALLTTRHLKAESDGAAEHVAAQTACPSRDGPDLDHHYCAFVPVKTAAGEMHVVELDGTKRGPVDHGAAPAFLEGVAAVVRSKFMAVEPGSIEFSLMALCHAPGP